MAQISIDTEAVRQRVQQFNQQRETIREVIQRMAGIQAQLESDWSSKRAQEFHSQLNSSKKTFEDTITILDQVEIYLNSGANDFETADGVK